METALEQAWLEFGGLSLPPSHGWVKTLCVLHPERRPSAVVNVELGKWICHAGCGHGDVYDLIGVHESLRDFLDQKRYADEHGWVPEDTEPEPTLMNPKPKQNKGKKAKWRPSWI